MTKKVIIEVDKQGNTKVTGENFIGQECHAAMKPFESMGVITDRQALHEQGYTQAIPQQIATRNEGQQ